MKILNLLFDASSMDWVRFVIFFTGIFLFIGITEKTRAALGWSAEINRKLVHVLTGVLIFFTPYLFTSSKPLIWMAVLFMAINYAGVKTGKLKGMHGTERRSYGTVFYPATFLFLVVTCWQNHKTILTISMLILALSDAAAAIVGENLKHPHEYRLGGEKKSLEGSSVMFLMSFLIVFILLPLTGNLDGRTVTWLTAGWIALATALVATAAESLSSGGSDNLSAPLGAAFVLSFMLTHHTHENIQFTIGLGLALLVALSSYQAHVLTASGSVGTFLLATLIFGIGGWTWAVPVLTFFVLSSLLSKIGKTHKAQFGLVFEKSSRRDIGQVLANGGAPGLAMLLYNYFPHPSWYLFYLGALAAANSDTWATEIGLFSKIQPRSIKNFQKVPPGTSGGITPLGTFSGLLGSLIIVLSGLLIAPSNFRLSLFQLPFWIIVWGGFLASLIDSLLGATIQVQYQCPVCNKRTEKQKHCNENQTRLVSGYAWLNNDWVNAICSLSGAVFVWIGIVLIGS